MDANKQIEDAFHKFSSAVDELRKVVTAAQRQTAEQEQRDVSRYIRETIQSQQQTVGQEPRAADVANSFSAGITYEPYEIFRYRDGRMYQCVFPEDGCAGCSFRYKLCSSLNCTDECRADGLSVRFVHVWKPRAGMIYRTVDGTKCMLVRAPFCRSCLCDEHKGRCHGLNTLLFTGIRCKLMFNLKDWHWVPLD